MASKIVGIICLALAVVIVGAFTWGMATGQGVSSPKSYIMPILGVVIFGFYGIKLVRAKPKGG